MQLLQLLAGARPVDSEELSRYFEDQSRFSVFQLTDALLANQQDKAQHILAQLKAEETAMPIIHWALQKELTLLLTLQSARSQGESSIACSANIEFGTSASRSIRAPSPG